MPCWPDIWEYVSSRSQLLGTFAALVAYLGLIVVLLWAPKLRHRWLIFGSRILGALAFLPFIVILPSLLLIFVAVRATPPAESRLFTSPDGHQAELRYHAGFLGRDYTQVTLKHPDCCQHKVVFWDAGPSSFDATTVRWLDKTRQATLRLRARPGRGLAL